jgi:16S rRNA (cytosine967-C5)-methyltransferase
VLDIQLCAAAVLGDTLAGRNLSTAFEEGFRRHPGLSPGERSVVREICYEGLRSLGLLEAQLGKLLLTPVRHAGLRSLLLVALAQLQFTRAKPYAIVDHAVRAAERLGQPAARGLVNAVLRTFLRRRDDLGRAAWNSPEVRHGFPAWWVQKLREQCPGRWEEVLSAQNRHPPMTLRVNRRRTTLENYLESLGHAGIQARPLGEMAVRIDPRPVPEIPGFEQGLASVQDCGAQWAARLLDVADGQRVLDACAAPGGKTGHLLELARLDLLALDNDPARLGRIGENLSRLGLEARLACADAAQPGQWWDGRAFHRVLLDVPCSASGVARRHPDIRWNRRPSDLPKFAVRQSALLDAVWQVLETSGKLLYATCSVFREENESVVEAFLSRQPGARLLKLHAGAPEGGRIWPDDDSDGFYYALLEKR